MSQDNIDGEQIWFDGLEKTIIPNGTSIRFAFRCVLCNKQFLATAELKQHRLERHPY